MYRKNNKNNDLIGKYIFNITNNQYICVFKFIMSMSLRGIFKESPFAVQLAMLIGLFLAGMILGIIIFLLLGMIMGISPEFLSTNIDTMRVMQFIVSVTSFLLPSCYLAYLYSENVYDYLQLHKPSWNLIVLTVFTIIVFIPFLNYIILLNEQIVFPESMKPLETILRQMEDNAQALTKQLLNTDKISLFLFNIFLFGVIAGVGEEFFFRGVMQRIFQKITKNPHVVIWTVAFIFSAIHMQFYGFIPRMLLGAILGYLLLWTKSIWIPVIAHFTNNVISVVVSYFIPENDIQEKLDTIGTGDTFWMSFLSLLLGLTFLFAIKYLGEKKILLKE